MPHTNNDQDLQEMLVALRRELHQVPETGLELPLTRNVVIRELHALGLEPTLHTTSDGLTAVIHGTGTTPGDGTRSVLLRADMDALPIEESTGLAFASKNGAMHACGHDLHVAMLLGAARMLTAQRDQLAGDVILMFQPGEEGYDGARLMLQEGALEASGSPVVGAYALHVFSGGFGAGQVAVRPGPIMSASDLLTVTVHGKGGHGSTPQTAVDPIVIAAEMVVALQTMVTRRFDVFDPAVLTVTRIAGGHAASVIPDEATFSATVRTYSIEAQELMEATCNRVLEGLAAAHGAKTTIEYSRMYPVTANDPDEAARATRVARQLAGNDRVLELANPLTASEDFSRVLLEVPGAFIALGATPEGVDPETAAFNHSAEAVFDESCLSLGAALLAGLARDRIDDPAS